MNCMVNKEILFSSNSIFADFDIKSSCFTQEDLISSSRNESAKLHNAISYNGVDLFFLDISSCSPTGTFKDWVACATIAYCKKNGIKEFVTQSSGNTANAIAYYCRDHKIKAHVFYLKENKNKIKPEFLYKDDYITPYEVDCSELEMKNATKAFSEKMSVPWLPDLEIQILSNSIRADFVTYISETQGIIFDWKSQALSSAYGPFGFYHGLRRLGVNSKNGYKFHGVQQSAVCPFSNMFFPEKLENINLPEEKILEKTLFRSTPTPKMYDLMRNILNEFGGYITVVSNKEYTSYLDTAVELLNESNIFLVTNSCNDYSEKSGVINLIGVLKSINEGIIKNRESVLVAITGGVSNKSKE